MKIFSSMSTRNSFTGVFLTALLLVFVLTSARYAKTDFTGEWALSKEKSKLTEGGMRIVYTKLKVTQTGSDLNIARTAQTQDGQEFVMEEKITLDGKESANNFFDGMVNKKSTVKWSADEKAMTITSTIIFSRDGNEIKTNSTETWDMTKAPGALTIESASSSPNGEFKDTYVFDKK